MGEVLPLPHRGEVFLDPRGEGRSLRISGHRDVATVVLSIWRHGECRATFRLAGSEVDEFIRALQSAAPPSAPSSGAPPAVAGPSSVFHAQVSGSVVVELVPAETAQIDVAHAANVSTLTSVSGDQTKPVPSESEAPAADASAVSADTTEAAGTDRPATGGDDLATDRSGREPIN